jgi:hypothetical protein
MCSPEASERFHRFKVCMYTLQEHVNGAIPIRRGELTLKIVALGNDGLAVSEDHGLVRLSDDELEQGRLWVAQKTGTPVIATRVPIGGKRDTKDAQR